ncbi:hypothetical protein D3C73_1174200 [compost metagenome]
MLRISTARQQQVDHGQMATAGSTQQRGAALRINGVDGKAQIIQTTHGIDVAGHRGGRQIAFAQSPARQRPDPPVQPVGQIATTDRQRHAQRRLPIGSTRFGRGTVLHQQLQGTFARQCGGQMQRGHAMAFACFAVHAGGEQGLLQAQPTQAHRQ